MGKTTRATYGGGSITERKRADGSIVHRVQWIDAGRRRSRQFADRADALAFQAARLSAVKPRPPRGLTWDQAFVEWLAGSEVAAEQTRRSYLMVHRMHLSPVFGRVRLAEISADEIRRYLADRQSGDFTPVKGGRRVLSPRTLRLHLWLMRSVYDRAIYVGEHVGANPARAPRLSVSAVTGVKTMRKPRALDRTDHQVALWTSTPPEHRALIGVMLGAGLRYGEAAALTWDDRYIDSTGVSWLHVRRAVKSGGRMVGPPKSAAGLRKIALPPDLVAVMSDHYDNARDKSPGALMFPGDDGELIPNYHATRHILAPIWQSETCRAAGVPPVTAHMLRHTFAYIQINAGCSPSRLCQLLGHHSPSFTLARYGHFLRPSSEPVASLPGAPSRDASLLERAAWTQN